jgi:hypothetical protein
MSNNHRPPLSAISFISILIILETFAFAFFFIYFSNENAMAARDIWEHFKSLSLIVVGYWFGSVKENKH